MGLIGNSFVVAGVILTLLVGAVAWVVTRQVVAPVRRAGEVAQRLSAGKLNERMPTRGEDDLALLATSFNGMADSLQSQIRQLEGLSAVQQRFVSDVSHELRTPLTTIRMAVDLIHESRTGLRPHGGAGRPSCSPGSSTGSRTCSPTCSRSAGSTPARPTLDVEPVDLRGTIAKVVEAARPARRAPGERRHRARPRRARRGRGRRAPRRAHPAQPRRQRHRARRGAADRHPRRGRRRMPSPSSSRTTASACGRGRRPTSSPASGAPTRRGRAPPAAPAWACRSRSRTPGCTTAGSRRGASAASGRGSGSPCPSAPATPCTGRRCRSARRRTRERPGGPGRPSRVLVALVLGRVRRACPASGPVEPGLEVGSGNPPGPAGDLPGPGPGGRPGEHRARLRAGRARPATGPTTTPGPSSPPRTSEKWNPDGTLVLLADDAAPSRRPCSTPRRCASPPNAAGTVDAEGRYTAARAGQHGHARRSA